MVCIYLKFLVNEVKEELEQLAFFALGGHCRFFRLFVFQPELKKVSINRGGGEISILIAILIFQPKYIKIYNGQKGCNF